MRRMDVESIALMLAGDTVPRVDGLSNDDLHAMGLSCDRDKLWLAEDVERLDELRITRALNSRARRLWPHFEIAIEAPSTNATLLLKGAGAVGCALTVEYQSSGRGRRGRSWQSPIARNIAVSLAVERSGGLADMTGLSLLVGIAAADALRSLGLSDVALKWPNDLIVMKASGEYSKLGGILVELQQLPQRDGGGPGSALAVMGIGLNVGGAGLMSTTVDQSMADVAELQPGAGRNDVLIALVNALADYVDQWMDQGFEPMIEAYDSLHAFTGLPVSISSPKEVLEGVVLGVGAGGELRLQTADGERDIDVGEVSLRQSGTRQTTP